MELRVLIVDDEPEVSDLIARWIRMEAPHFSIAGVESGEDCLEYLKTNQVDCILSDYQMSGINGMELLHALRTQGNNVPFIFITAQGSEEVAREAFKNGADDYFTKDIGFAHFARIINSVEQSVKKNRAERLKSHAEDALKASENNLQTIIDSAPVCIKLVTVEGIVLTMNQAGLTMIEADALGQIKGRSVFDLVAPEYREAFKALGENVSQGGTGSLEFEMVSLKGSRLWLETRAVPLRNERDEITALLCITLDIKERKQAEEALQDSEERFRTLFEFAEDGIFLVDGPIFVDCNSRGMEMYGFQDKGEIIGHSFLEFAPSTQPDGESSQGMTLRVVPVVLNGTPQKFNWTSIRKDGEFFDTEVSLNRVVLKGKTYIQAIVRDLTARKQTEQALQESEERFRTLFESADDGIFLQDAGIFVDCNSKGAEMYGYDDKSDVVGHHPMEFAPPVQPDGESSEDKALRFIEAALNGEPQKFYWRPKRKDGTLFDVEVSLSRLDLKGKTYSQAIVRDITERKRMEEAIKFNNVLLSAQQEATLDGILVVDPAGKIISYNRRFIELWKIPIPQEVEDTRSDELAIQSVLQYLKKPEEFLKRVNYLYEHRTETSRDEIELKDGRTLDRYSAPMFGADERYYGRVWYFRDITEMKKLERQRADFYAMVTHDLKSPLTAILGYSSLISEAAIKKADEGIEEMAKAVGRGGVKLMRLVDDFLAGGMEPGSIRINPVPVDVAGLLTEVSGDFEPLVRQKGVVLRVDISDRLPAASFDRKHFERAVGNLLQNAFNYTPKGGEITLKAEAKPDVNGGYVYVAVSDTGPGIAPEEQGKIFNKYYRSPKTSGVKGTGLGLAIVKAVAEAHGGRVELESEVGKGSTFRLVLPVGP